MKKYFKKWFSEEEVNATGIIIIVGILLAMLVFVNLMAFYLKFLSK